MDDTTRATIVPTLVIVLAPLIQLLSLVFFRVLGPRVAIGTNVLVCLGCAALAVTFFWLLQSLQRPVLAYLAAFVYGVMAIEVFFLAVFWWLALRNTQRQVAPTLAPPSPGPPPRFRPHLVDRSHSPGLPPERPLCRAGQPVPLGVPHRRTADALARSDGPPPVAVRLQCGDDPRVQHPGNALLVDPLIPRLARRVFQARVVAANRIHAHDWNTGRRGEQGAVSCPLRSGGSGQPRLRRYAAGGSQGRSIGKSAQADAQVARLCRPSATDRK